MEKAINSPENSFEHSSILHTMGLIGERWTLCVLNEAFSGVRRFDEMREHLGIASNILSNRLNRLVTNNILEQVPYKEAGRRTRYEYQLTQKGRDLLPALLALIAWGDRYMPDASLASATMVHTNCGQEVAVKIVCAQGHEVQSVQDIQRVVKFILQR